MSGDAPSSELLDLDNEEFRRRGRDVIDWIAGYLESTREYPVLSRNRPGELADALPDEGPETPVEWEALLRDLDEKILPAMTHWNHPRFFAYFANTGSAPGILGAALATALNPNGMLWRTSPAATELESRVTRWLAAWLGLGDMPFGIINDTASTSSLVALAAAREAVPAYDRQQGMRSVGVLRIYASEQAHSSIDKAAAILGMGLDAVRRIETRDDYTLDPVALQAAIAADRAAGVTPVCIVATTGTTSTTSIDPVNAIADIAESESIWLHVDAAYGGAAAIVPRLRDRFHGWDRGDTIVINPHKWLFTPMCCSVLYARQPEKLAAAFSLVPEYLRSDVGDNRGAADEPVDYMNYGVQLGRPFRALTLWMVLSTYGREAMAGLVDDHVTWVEELAAIVDADPDFERLAPTPLSTLCFRHRPGAGSTGDGSDLGPVEEDAWASRNERLMAAVNAEGTTFLSHTRLRGRLCLRLAVGNLRTTRADVHTAWDKIREAAAQLD